jgi:hypothetical protein
MRLHIFIGIIWLLPIIIWMTAVSAVTQGDTCQGSTSEFENVTNHNDMKCGA